MFDGGLLIERCITDSNFRALDRVRSRILGLAVLMRTCRAGCVGRLDFGRRRLVYGVAFVDGSTSSGTDDWISPTTVNPYASTIVDGPPNFDTDPARRCDIIALSQATVKVLELSEPVTNPLFAVVSLDGNGYRASIATSTSRASAAGIGPTVRRRSR